MKRILMGVLFVSIMMFSMMTGANAAQYVIDGSSLAIAPYAFYADTDPGSVNNEYYALNAGGVWYGYQSGNNSLVAAVTRILGSYDEAYKGEGGELGPLVSSYTTSMLDTHNWTITYDGGPYVVNPYIVVKDGNADPSWFLLSSTWNGMDDLKLVNFFVATDTRKGGGISHVSFLGTAQVPEPMSLLLLGLGLVGLAGVGRKLKK